MVRSKRPLFIEGRDDKRNEVNGSLTKIIILLRIDFLAALKGVLLGGLGGKEQIEKISQSIYHPA